MFAQISPNLPEKTTKKMISKKNDCISFHFGHSFSNQNTSRTIFLQISHNLAQLSPNLPEKTEKHDLQKKSVFRGIIFVKSEPKGIFQSFHTFFPNFHRFWPDFKGFCPHFHQIKIFGVCSHPCILHHWCYGISLFRLYLQWNTWFILNSVPTGTDTTLRMTSISTGHGANATRMAMMLTSICETVLSCCAIGYLKMKKFSL